MTHHSPVDREAEIARFDEIIGSKTEERILLVEAQSGWGKSVLLDEFGYRKPKKFKFAKIDFKSGNTSLAELFSRLRDKLGGKSKFTNLGAELNSILHPSVAVSSNLLVGRNQIDTYLSGSDEQQRQARLAALTDALFTDLRSLGKMLLIFDTFERGNEEVRNWMSDAFLSRVQNSPNIYVVIGGQHVPDESLEWDAAKIPLRGIPHEHWHRYAQSIGVTIDIEYIHGCCDVFEGHPLKMKNYIDAYLVRGR